MDISMEDVCQMKRQCFPTSCLLAEHLAITINRRGTECRINIHIVRFECLTVRNEGSMGL
jgi:hypothetical protein